MNHPFGCSPEAEAMMTPDQGERYLRIIKIEAEYWDTGDGFGGRYFRDFDKEAFMYSALHEFCCEVLGEEPYASKPLPPEWLA